ncbi:hypothetical protein [Rhodococcus jostii]|uniref:DUF4432 domain-containing protein n=1 Tax=Rhodococcus jostii TaxID=132919 RepID=A0ABU4CTP9_RHOJO|nr:hypothetical protein [Rhodococcus jostii]MDV6286585.1 hypothetical protein [Rhodococcus jostii]
MILQNEHLRVTLEPEYGAQITSITAPGFDDNALAHYDWATPQRARDGQRYGNSTDDWLSSYRGGWQELFPNSGAESTIDGVITPFHGEASVAPWETRDSRDDACVLRVGTRSPLVVVRSMRLLTTIPVLVIEETVTNESDHPREFIWGHHPTVPALPGGRIDLPPCTVAVEAANPGDAGPTGGNWPRIPGRDGGAVDLSTVPDATVHRLTYQHDLTEGWVAFRPPADGTRPGVALAWDLDTWPALWMWLLRGTDEFPWYGRADMLGLEPNRSWPFDGLDGARARGQHITLGPRQSHHTWLTLRLITDHLACPITGVDRQGALTRAIPADEQRSPPGHRTT